MKSRSRMMKDQMEQLRVALDESRAETAAVHEKLMASETEARVANVAAEAAAREQGMAERARDQAQRERDAAVEQANTDQRTLAETIGQRDGWSERAQAVTVERDELVVALREMTERAVAAERKHEDLSLGKRQWDDQSREASEQADLAVTERNEARLERDEAMRECASAQEDARVLAERLQHAQDALEGSEESRLMGERKLAEVQQALDDCRQSRGIIQAQRDTILAAGAEQGIMIPMPGGPMPRVAVSSGEDVPLIACENWGEHMGHAWWGASHSGPEMRWCDGRNADGTTPYDPAHENVILKHFGVREDQSVTIGGVDVPTVVGGHAVPITGYDDHPGPAGAERLRFEDAAFDAMREALLAITGTESYDPDAVAGKLRLALGMMDSSGHHVRERVDEFGGGDPRALIEHWQGVAKRQEERADKAERGYSELHSRLVVMMEQRDEAVATLESEREQGLLPPDEKRLGYASYVALRDTLAQVERERDKAIEQRKSVEAAWTDTVASVRREVGQMQAERDAARADAERARSMAMDSMIIDGAMENALGKLAGMVGIDKATIESPADIVEGAMQALHIARVGMGDVSQSVARLGRSLGIEKWNPADPDVHGVIDTAIRRMAALDRERLSARSEAGALKLTLAIIDERQRQRGEGEQDVSEADPAS